MEKKKKKKAKSPKTEANHLIRERSATKHTRGANDNFGFHC